MRGWGWERLLCPELCPASGLVELRDAWFPLGRDLEATPLPFPASGRPPPR